MDINSISGYNQRPGAIDASNLNIKNTAGSMPPLHQAFSEAHISHRGQLINADDTLQMAVLALMLPKAFIAQKVTSSAPTVATASAKGVPPGEYNVEVTQLAQSQTLVTANPLRPNAAIGNGSATIEFTFASSTRSIALALNENNLAAISLAINRARIGISAGVLNTPAGSQLQLTGNTGAINSFSVRTTGDNQALMKLLNSTARGGLTQTAAAQDAQGSVNGVNFSSSSNAVFTDTAGLALNLKAVGSTTLTVSPTFVNVNGVQSFVNAFNHLLSVLQRFEGGESEEDWSLTPLLTQLETIFSQSQADLGGIGITRNQTGNLAFDRAIYQAALAGNPAAVAQVFSNHGSGIADQILALIEDNIATLNRLQSSNGEHRVQEYEHEHEHGGQVRGHGSENED
jgi:flagellar hook-associated protein 2